MVEADQAPAPEAGRPMMVAENVHKSFGRLEVLRGIERLTRWEPSFDDMYFNYYATQVLHHQEGPAWSAWNDRLRKHLVASQATSGHEAGSWHFADPHTDPGGRLCDTALSLLILEVYYRHLPLYGLTAIDLQPD